jgi:hypothetical protein
LQAAASIFVPLLPDLAALLPPASSSASAGALRDPLPTLAAKLLARAAPLYRK